MTKFGQKGILNLHKAIPFVGAPVGGAFDGTACKGIAVYAKKQFPTGQTDRDGSGVRYHHRRAGARRLPRHPDSAGATYVLTARPMTTRERSTYDQLKEAE